MIIKNLHEMDLITPPKCKGAGSYFKRFLQRKRLLAANPSNIPSVTESTETPLLKGKTEIKTIFIVNDEANI